MDRKQKFTVSLALIPFNLFIPTLNSVVDFFGGFSGWKQKAGSGGGDGEGGVKASR